MKGVNVPFMIMSLVASVALWMYVYIQNTKPMTPVSYSVHLEAGNLDTTRYVVTKMDDVIRFSATGPDDDIQRMKDKDLAAIVDLARAQPGTRLYPVQVLPQEFQSYINQKQLEAKVSIEPLQSKSVPVTVEGQGHLSDSNMRLTDTVVDPTEVTLSGPQSQVEKAIRARARLDLSKVDPAASHSYNVDLDVLDRDDRPLDPTLLRTDPIFVRITPVLTVSPEDKTAFVVPQFKGEPATGHVCAGYDWEPKHVQLRGPSLALASIGKVVTAPIDIAGIRSSAVYQSKLIVPAGVTVQNGKTSVTVRVYVRSTSETTAQGAPNAKDKVNTPNP